MKQIFGMEKWLLFALLSMLFAGLTSVLAKIGLKEIDANTALVLRTAVVMLFVIMNFLIFNQLKGVSELSSKHVFFLVLSGATTSLSWIFYYKALKIGNVSNVAVIDKGSIVTAIILSYLVLKEPLTPKLLIGGGLVLCGLLVMVIME